MIDQFFVRPDTTVREVMSCIDRNGKGVALLIDGDQRLLQTITDGDLRRGILAGMSLDAPLALLRERLMLDEHPPITAPVGTDRTTQIEVMRTRSIRQLPLVDEQQHVLELAMLDDLLPVEPLKLQAVLMAGGFGSRLRPLTDDTPKPMLPVGGRPLMELILQRLRRAGVHRVNVTTHFRSDKIRDHFGDGEKFGVELAYVNEEQPLGTAGALALLETNGEPLLVINGDILTDVNFRAMLTYHQENAADITVGVRHYELNVPYGVVDCQGSLVRRLKEKPQLDFFVNAGVYLLEPTVHQFLPRSGERFDMTELIQAVLQAERRVAGFPICEYWIDIGQHHDYERAQADFVARERGE